MKNIGQTSSGGTLESTIKSVLQSKGVEIVSYREREMAPERFSKELLLTNAPFQSIYNHSGKTEFLLLSHKHDLKIRIECKWQQVAGSVDEKLPYLYLNTIEAMPENDIIIVIDGKGWKSGSIGWLKDAVRQKKYANDASSKKNIMVMNLQEFLTWANEIFK